MKAGLNIRRNVITTVVAFFINIAMTFIGYRLLVLQGGTEALGLWSALTAAIFVIRLGDVGMAGAAERHVAAADARVDPHLVRGYLDTALVLNCVLFLVLALVGWALLSWRIDWFVPGVSAMQAEAQVVLPLMLAGFVMTNLANVVTGGLRGLHLGYLAAWLSVLGGLVQLVVILILVPPLGLAGLAWAQLAQAVVMGCFAWIVFNRHLGLLSDMRPPVLPWTGSRALLRELFGFSLRAQAVNLLNGLFEPAAKLMVGHAAGLSVLGLFEMAWKIVALPRNAVVSGVLGMTPAMTRLFVSDRAEARRLYFRARRLVTWATAGVLVTVTAGSPVVSVLLLGRIDMMLAGFIAVMAVGFWVNAIGAPAYALGFAAAQMWTNLASALLSLGLVLVVGWGLSQIAPINGPVMAAALALAFGGLFILWRNQRLLAETT